jgi:hypothetical protein
VPAAPLLNLPGTELNGAAGLIAGSFGMFPDEHILGFLAGAPQWQAVPCRRGTTAGFQNRTFRARFCRRRRSRGDVGQVLAGVPGMAME